MFTMFSRNICTHLWFSPINYIPRYGINLTCVWKIKDIGGDFQIALQKVGPILHVPFQAMCEKIHFVKFK